MIFEFEIVCWDGNGGGCGLFKEILSKFKYKLGFILRHNKRSTKDAGHLENIFKAYYVLKAINW